MLKNFAKIHKKLLKKRETNLSKDMENKDFSGVFTVRVSAETHRRLATEASLKNTSIANIVNHKILDMFEIEDFKE